MRARWRHRVGVKAYGIYEARSTSDVDCFQECEWPMPVPNPGELLIRVRAMAVNPVDTKVRRATSGRLEQPRVLGWDASGEVLAVGAEVTGFVVGDEVYYAGELGKAGCYATHQCVDARLVAHKPQRLSFAEAAAMPLTTLTAWEGFERMRFVPGKTILIIGGAGGVGSIAIQLAKRAGLRVIATASREESRQWCLRMGADDVIDHRDLLAQTKELGLLHYDFIANFVDTDGYWSEMVELMAPLGEMLLIVEPKRDLPLGDPLKAKCVSIHWEFMFGRSRYQTDLAHQGDILRQASVLFDQASLSSTLHTHLGEMNAETLRKAHKLLESGRAVGKVVLSVPG